MKPLPPPHKNAQLAEHLRYLQSLTEWTQGHVPVVTVPLVSLSKLIEVLNEYEHAINWHTTCINCASMWDTNYAMYMKIEELEGRKSE